VRPSSKPARPSVSAPLQMEPKRLARAGFAQPCVGRIGKRLLHERRSTSYEQQIVVAACFVEVPVRTDAHTAGTAHGVVFRCDQLELVLRLGRQQAIGLRENVGGPEHVECLDAGEDEKRNGQHRFGRGTESGAEAR